jgi:hypothetical protein
MFDICDIFSQENVEKGISIEEGRNEEYRVFIGNWDSCQPVKTHVDDISDIDDIKWQLPVNYRVLADFVKNWIKSYGLDDIFKIEASKGGKKIIGYEILSENVFLDFSHGDKKDLFDIKKEPEYQTIDEYYNDVLCNIIKDDPIYRFYTLNEIRNKLETILCSFGWVSDENKLFLSRGTIIPKSENESQIIKIDFILNTLFNDENNWKIIKSYMEVARSFDNGKLPYNVVCYEKSSYFEESGIELIETTVPINNVCIEDFSVDKDILVFVFLNTQKSNNKQILFKGVYRFDVELSMKENHYSFRRQTSSYVIKLSM